MGRSSRICLIWQKRVVRWRSRIIDKKIEDVWLMILGQALMEENREIGKMGG